MTTPLQDLFEAYKDSYTSAQETGYLSVCSQIEDIRKGRQNLTEDFLRQIWTAQKFGPAKQTRGVLTRDEFQRAKKELEALTRHIINDSSPSSIAAAYLQLEQLAKKKVLPFRPKTATHRLAAACDPKRYSCVVYEDAYLPLYQWLRQEYGLSIVGSAWAETDSAMRKALIEDHGLSDSDPIRLNTFIWSLVKRAKQAVSLEPSAAPSAALGEERSTVAEEKPRHLNTIYYGPPGTGKTYTAMQVLKTHFVDRIEHISPEQWAEGLVREVIWRNVVAAALHDRGDTATVSELCNHPLVQAKFRCAASDRSSRARIWSTLQSHTPEASATVNTAKKRPPSLFDKLNDGLSSWTLLPGWEEEAPEASTLQRAYEAGPPSPPGSHEEKRYACITFHQSYSYEEFVEGIRPMLADEEGESELAYTLHDGIFKLMCEKAHANPHKDYALLIDEINRGNISRIFGELITLLEKNKRAKAGQTGVAKTGEAKGEENTTSESMETILPYSGTGFSVPDNLYIIGTMNTADRSLALMDMALRRRFTFRRIVPNPSLLEGEMIEGVDLEILLQTINNRLAALYDEEHLIGHSYFMEVNSMDDLQDVFLNKIFPLLEEYFFDDPDKIRLVLGEPFKEEALCLMKIHPVPAELKDLEGTPLQLRSQCSYNTDTMQNPKAYMAIYAPKTVKP